MWDAVCSSFDLPHDERLVYFWGHVGGDEPAEGVHVEMTRMMVAELVPPDRREEFIELCLEGYALNFHWCEAITASSIREASETVGRVTLYQLPPRLRMSDFLRHAEAVVTLPPRSIR